MRQIAVNIARLLLAVTFILSGFVKAVDPLGTQYKIRDYLNAMHLGQYVPDYLTLGASVTISAMEFLIGICLLFAIHRRLVSKFLVVLMSVMTLLTLWLALTDPISDCGCFGDAIVLTNWQTFWKNVVLLAAAILVALWPKDMARMISLSNQWIVFNYSTLFILFIAIWCLYDLPL
ncbi:MAG: MauE/DoxX family redox-associated membrane protein, partial [Prevotella sp.]|nr:MauE/DoxX family redox-associated membrane protein [Prevotella sp.]